MHCRTALSLLSTLLIAGPLVAQAEPARHVVEGARSRALAARERLGLDIRHDFGVRRADKDELGQTHTRLDQFFQGVRVWGGELIAHSDAEGGELGNTLEIRKNIALSVQPTLGSREALAVAHADLRPAGAYAYDPTTELVIYPEVVDVPRPRRGDREADGAEVTRQVLRYTLAYHVHTEIELGDDTRHTDFMIDAHSGRIIKKWSTLRVANANGTGYSQFSGTVTLSTNSVTSGYELRDMTRGTGGTFGNNVVTNMNKGTSGNGTVYTDADNTWGDGANYVTSNATTSANGQTTAVDAAYGMQLTWDMLKNEYGRNGINGAGKATYSRVHYSSNYVNAFWSDSCFCMTYGDGNSSYKTLTSLDVAAHEMGHGVCANSANLVYSGESGGLNEANSDIIAALAELYHRNGKVMPSSASNTDNAWKIGEQLSSSPLRYMYKPSLDGASPDAWSSTLKNIDVHYSSGPGNRMFFFLSQGASNTSSSQYYSSYTPAGFTGIGPAKAGKIWYRALTAYMTSSTNYAGARTACINAAKDLYGAGGVEEAAVWNAFAAINVGSAWSGGGSTDTTAPTVSVSASGTSGTITFNASASDNVGVTKVEWYVNGTLRGSDTTSPYSMTFDSTTLANGTHTLVGKAYDAAGNVGTSSSVSFTTSNTTTGSELVTNGGFESGTTPWVGTTGAIGTWSGQPAYEGTRCAWLGGNGKKTTESLYQQVTIPSTATSATLTFYLHIDTAETTTSTAYDKCVVTVKNSSGTTLKTLATYSNLNKAAGYQVRTFDLSAYKGQTVRVHFNMTEDSSLQTSFVVDKVSLVTK